MLSKSLNKGLDTGYYEKDYGLKLGQGFNSQGFDLGINPLSVGSAQGQLIPGTIGSGAKVSSGELGDKMVDLPESSNKKSALGEVLLQGGKSLSSPKRKASISMTNTGGGQLGKGLRFEDLYGVKF